MIRNNKEIQELADRCAQKHGYFCASYLGRKKNDFIYATRYQDSEPRTEGLPALIVVKDMTATFVMGMESFDVLDNLRFRDYKKGRSIFKEYERKVDENDFESDDERKYISEIVYNQRPGFDIPIEKTELYDYLEIADRLNMNIELKPCEYSKDRLDGWEYYIELVEK